MNEVKFISQVCMIAAVVMVCSCSKKVVPAPVEMMTIALPNQEEGTIVLRSSGQAKNEALAIDDADKKAFRTLLFYGIPSSVQSRPVIENEMQSKQANPAFFKNFFDKKDYNTFVVNSSTYSSVKRSSKSHYVIRELKINLRSLRANLESNGVIRKFGF